MSHIPRHVPSGGSVTLKSDTYAHASLKAPVNKVPSHLFLCGLHRHLPHYPHRQHHHLHHHRVVFSSHGSLFGSIGKGSDGHDKALSSPSIVLQCNSSSLSTIIIIITIIITIIVNILLPTPKEDGEKSIQDIIM